MEDAGVAAGLLATGVVTTGLVATDGAVVSDQVEGMSEAPESTATKLSLSGKRFPVRISFDESTKSASSEVIHPEASDDANTDHVDEEMPRDVGTVLIRFKRRSAPVGVIAR